MKLRYAFLALLLAAPAVASAQSSADAVFPEFIISTPSDIAATISNYDYSNLPRPPYTLPDTTGGLPIIGTSVFQVVMASGDTLSRGTVHTLAGVTRPVALALTSGGTPALGCVSASDSSSDIGNGADLAGKIVLVQRGVCPFYVKAKNVLAAGADAFVIYNPFDRTPDTAINMAGGRVEDPVITIPGAFLPWDLAEPIFNTLASGIAVEGTLRCDSRQPDPCPVGTAGEGAPSAAGAGLFLAGQNPTSTTARLVVRTPAAENVSVIAYNMLGQQVAVLHNGAVLGQQVVTLQATDLPSGSYFVRAVGETFTQTQQITVVR